ncbi:MAG: Holliday junction resolvase RuvX [Bacteroidota bacterium]
MPTRTTMGRLLAIDYGMKRTGLAVSDPMCIIATALDTVETAELIKFLQQYFQKETVDRVVIGIPRRFDNAPSEMAEAVKTFMALFASTFPAIPITGIDERFTTVRAHEAMIKGGMKKKDRQEKGAADRISATIILQEYMALHPGT